MVFQLIVHAESDWSSWVKNKKKKKGAGGLRETFKFCLLSVLCAPDRSLHEFSDAALPILASELWVVGGGFRHCIESPLFWSILTALLHHFYLLRHPQGYCFEKTIYTFAFLTWTVYCVISLKYPPGNYVIRACVIDSCSQMNYNISSCIMHNHGFNATRWGQYIGFSHCISHLQSHLSALQSAETQACLLTLPFMMHPPDLAKSSEQICWNE